MLLDKFDPSTGWWAAGLLLAAGLWRTLSIGARFGGLETKVDRCVSDIATLQADMKEVLRHMKERT